MIKVLATNVKIEDNFGGPSILHGLQEVLKILYGDDYELIYYQTTKYNEYAIKDYNFKIKYIPFSKKDLKLNLFRDPRVKEYIKDIKSSDVVVDLLGICFSDAFRNRHYNHFRLILDVLYLFRMLSFAKLYHKTVVKNTCSFGPMKYEINQKSALFACNHLFDMISAREIESRNALINDAKVKKEIYLSPDIANMMAYSIENIPGVKKIGISTSHQIIKQWKGEDGYVDSIVDLCQHITKRYSLPIILIPNEVQPKLEYNDIAVSKEIQERLNKESIHVEIIDSAHMCSTELKNIIASCEVLIASRYHSCVAALSSGVPTLVIGWHYKYEELLHWYGQDTWNIPTNECTLEKLTTKFDKFWEARDESRKIIIEKYPEVRKAILETANILFAK